jgi:hypothetical protein
MEQRCLQPYVKVTSANLDSDANHMYRKLRWKLQYVQHGRIHSYSNAAPN